MAVRTWRIYSVIFCALGVSLLVPNTFGDPNSTDPHAIRLAVTVGGLLIATYVVPSVRDARVLLLAFASVVIPYALWASSFQVFSTGFGSISEGGLVLIAGLVLTASTVAVVVWLRHEIGVRLRMRSFGRPSLGFSAGGTLVFLLGALAIPANALGRVGIAIPATLDAVANGLIAGDLLQAFSQELAFRGALLAVLESSLTPWQANLAQSVLFGFGHLALEQYEGPTVTLIPLTVVLGLVLGWVTQKTKSLWPAIIIHAVAEVAVRVAVIPGLYGG